jgi:hypothetical protein
MDEAPLEPVTMVSALPARLALPEPTQAPGAPLDPPGELDVLEWDGSRPDGPGSLTGSSVVGGAPATWTVVLPRGDEERAAAIVAWHARLLSRGPVAAVLTGWSRGLLEGLPSAPRRLELAPGRSVALLDAATFVAHLGRGEPASPGLGLSLAPGIEVPTDDDGRLVPAELLWQLLNRGHALLLAATPEQEEGDAPAEPATGTIPSATSARTLDRVPPLRDSVTPEVHRVPRYLVLVDADDTDASTITDTVRRLLAEAPDAHVAVPGAAEATSAYLRARFSADPRVLTADATIPSAVPFVARTTPGVRVTGEVLSGLVEQAAELQASLVRVLLPDADERSQLSLVRLAAVHRILGVDEPLRPDATELAPPALEEVGRHAGLAWVLPEKVGLEQHRHEGTEDVLDESGAMEQRELSLVARLQARVTDQESARIAVERERDERSAALSKETDRRRRAEERLARLQARKVVRAADWIGDLRRG